MPEGVTTRAPDEIDRLIAARIRAERLARGVSQQELGQRVGVAFQQIQKYEGGGNRVSAGRLVRIAEALGCDPAALFRPAGQAAAEVGPARGDADLSDGRFLEAYRTLSAGTRGAVERLVAAIARAEAEAERRKLP